MLCPALARAYERGCLRVLANLRHLRRLLEGQRGELNLREGTLDCGPLRPRVQVLGCIDPGEGLVWTWAALPAGVPAALCGDAERLRGYGQAHGVAALCTPRVALHAFDAELLGVVAAQVCGADAALLFAHPTAQAGDGQRPLLLLSLRGPTLHDAPTVDGAALRRLLGEVSRRYDVDARRALRAWLPPRDAASAPGGEELRFTLGDEELAVAFDPAGCLRGLRWTRPPGRPLSDAGAVRAVRGELEGWLGERWESARVELDLRLDGCRARALYRDRGEGHDRRAEHFLDIGLLRPLGVEPGGVYALHLGPDGATIEDHVEPGAADAGPTPGGPEARRRLARRALRERTGRVQWEDRGALVALDLAGLESPRPALAALRGAPALRELVVDGLVTHRDELSLLAALPALRYLRLRDCRLDERSFSRLLGCARLEELDLCGSNVGDGFLRSLTALPGLRALDLRGTAVSADGLAALAEARPRLRVRSERPPAPGPEPGILRGPSAGECRLPVFPLVVLWLGLLGGVAAGLVVAPEALEGILSPGSLGVLAVAGPLLYVFTVLLPADAGRLREEHRLPPEQRPEGLRLLWKVAVRDESGWRPALCGAGQGELVLCAWGNDALEPFRRIPAAALEGIALLRPRRRWSLDAATLELATAGDVCELRVRGGERLYAALRELYPRVG